VQSPNETKSEKRENKNKNKKIIKK